MIGKTFIGVAAAALVASSVNAADWWVINIDKRVNVAARYVEFTDAEKLPQADGSINAWSYSIYDRPQGGGYKSIKILEAFDCSGKRSRLLATYTFNENNISKEKDDESDKWIYVVPGSNLEAKWLFVCGRSLKDAFRVSPSTPEHFAAKTLALRK